MQRSSARRRLAVAPAETTLDADALALHRVMSDLVRMFQFRDRDRICCHDISVTQCYALEALATHDGQTLNDLAAELFLDKSTASRVVDALVAKGYALRGPHPHDGRAVLITITARGRRLYEKIDAELLGEVRSVAASFSAEVRRSMAAMLEGLLRAAAPRLAGGACCGVVGAIEGDG
jgi:MarR family transcriptional regulator, 2-MHQ and catechol-resistance regulon repressor